jgi:chemotaxis protein CheD
LKAETAISLKKHFLYPSAVIVCSEPCEITTILGSCVAVCIYDPVLKTGGMNHFMLPLWNGIGLESPKYGNIAIERLITKIISRGSNRNNLIAKVFGGGEIIEGSTQNYNIGKRNVEITRDLMKKEGIPVVSSSIGGKLGRKIIFNTHTGEIRHYFINKLPVQI